MPVTLPTKIGALTVDGVNPEYNDPKYITPPDQTVKSLRFWQPGAYNKVKDARFAMVAAFCGSGKSILQVALGIHDVVQSDYKQKQLIIVPQSHIHKGFVGDGAKEYVPIELEGKIYNWKITDNFCDDKSTGVLEGLKKWLLKSEVASWKRDDGIITGISAVSSHMALGIVWGKLTAAEKKQAIKNLTLRVDEAHHVKGIYDIDEGEGEGELNDIEKELLEKESTNLGAICRYMFNSKDVTAKVHLTTATPYRGDHGIIISKAVLNKFEVYYLDWLYHFKTLGIEKFHVEYEEYYGDPIKQVVAKIKDEPKEKHLIVIPSTTHKWRPLGDNELQKLLDSIYKVVPKKRVLDLVTPSTQDKNKNKLLQEPKKSSDGESKYDVVVSCMLGREGTDWCPCSRLHNTSCEASITLAVQTMGRPFRRYEGKTEIFINYYVPQFKAPKKDMTKRELLSDRTNALLVCMTVDEMCHPILLPQVNAENKRSSDDDGEEKQERFSLVDIFGSQYNKVKQELFEEIECLEDKTDAEIDSVIEDIIDAYKVTDQIEDVRDALRVLVLRALSPKLRSLGIDVSRIREEGFDKIIEENGLKDASIFFGDFTHEDWKTVREILKRSWDEMFEEVKKRAIAK